jgi:hypothetical protein
MQHMTRRSIQGIAVFFLLLTSLPAFADSVAYRCKARSQASGYTIEHQKSCTAYVVKSKGRVVQRGSLGFQGSGDFVLTADHRTVVFINSWPYASLNPKGGFMVYGRKFGKSPSKAKLYAVAIFRDGKLVKRHLMRDLLVRSRMVTASVSHLSWLLSQPVVTAKTLTLKTTSFRDVTIELSNGRMVGKDSPRWTSCSALVYGKMVCKSSGWGMAPAYWAKGKGPKKLTFSVNRGTPPSVCKRYRTVCLVRKGSGWHASRIFGEPMFNGLTF